SRSVLDVRSMTGIRIISDFWMLRMPHCIWRKLPVVTGSVWHSRPQIRYGSNEPASLKGLFICHAMLDKFLKFSLLLNIVWMVFRIIPLLFKNVGGRGLDRILVAAWDL